MLAYAFIRGWVLGQHTFLLADANGWGMWLLLLSVLDIAATKARCWREILIPGLLAASVWMLVETMVLFYFFSHGFFDALGPVYYWIRRTGVGEMTKVLPDAAVYRIFFQSHLYAVVIVPQDLSRPCMASRVCVGCWFAFALAGVGFFVEKS